MSEKYSSNNLAKTSSIDEDNSGSDSFANGFATIDLNTGGSGGVHSPSFNNSSYTSFGEHLQSNTNSNQTSQSDYALNNTNTTSPNHQPNNLTSSFSSSFNGQRNSSPSVSMMSSASDMSSKLASRTISTFETFKQWSKSAYKCTRQIVSEKLGKSSRTVDPELDLVIEVNLTIFFNSN